MCRKNGHSQEAIRQIEQPQKQDKPKGHEAKIN